MKISMPILTLVKCVKCDARDEAWWSDFGAEQGCFNCDAPAVELVRI